jgi:hypothetical protein
VWTLRMWRIWDPTNLGEGQDSRSAQLWRVAANTTHLVWPAANAASGEGSVAEHSAFWFGPLQKQQVGKGAPAEVSAVCFGPLQVRRGYLPRSQLFGLARCKSKGSEFIKGIADLPTLLSWRQILRRGSSSRKKHKNILLQPITEVAQPDSD